MLFFLKAIKYGMVGHTTKFSKLSKFYFELEQHFRNSIVADVWIRNIEWHVK